MATDPIAMSSVSSSTSQLSRPPSRPHGISTSFTTLLLNSKIRKSGPSGNQGMRENRSGGEHEREKKVKRRIELRRKMNESADTREIGGEAIESAERLGFCFGEMERWFWIPYGPVFNPPVFVKRTLLFSFYFFFFFFFF